MRLKCDLKESSQILSQMVSPKSMLVLSAILDTRENHSMGGDVVFKCCRKSLNYRIYVPQLTVENKIGEFSKGQDVSV